jgi:organic radical activating enzyme
MIVYSIKEIFYSLQGEGVRAGIPHVFVRFAGCNLDCAIKAGPLSPGGFQCDTDWKNGTAMTIEQLLEAIQVTDVGKCHWVLLTGGEPALQIDSALIQSLQELEYGIAIETNGTCDLPVEIDWVTCSPKVGPIRLKYADELRCVLVAGQPLPNPQDLPSSANYLISPASDGDQLNRENVEWCMKLVMASPVWRLSVQYHKVLRIR